MCQKNCPEGYKPALFSSHIIGKCEHVENGTLITIMRTGERKNDVHQNK